MFYYLKDVIERLRQEDPNKVLRNGFHNPHSWRGDYSQLAFEPAKLITVEEMLEATESAVGTTYTGWKGGSYTMGDYSEVYIANRGETGVDRVGKTLLEYMLADECKTCTSVKKNGGFGPPHHASKRCESGRHPHCSCDTCF